MTLSNVLTSVHKVSASQITLDANTAINVDLDSIECRVSFFNGLSSGNHSVSLSCTLIMTKRGRLTFATHRHTKTKQE